MSHYPCGCPYGECQHPGRSDCQMPDFGAEMLKEGTRPLHKSGLTKEPPPVTSAPGLVPAMVEFPNGRIGWPTFVQYDVSIPGGGVQIQDYPPNTKEAPVEKILVLDKNYKPTMDQPTQDRTASYRTIIHDLPAYEALKATGMLMDPRHTGNPWTENVDNRNVKQTG